MEAFLARTVIPKLVYCLQTLVINPQNEQIGQLSRALIRINHILCMNMCNFPTDPVKWIFSWTELIPIHHFVDMFVKYFFPKWLQVNLPYIL